MLSSLWVIVPFAVAFTIIPILNSQRDVINIIANNLSAPVNHLISSAVLPVAIFITASLFQELFGTFRNIVTVKMSKTATEQLQSDIINKANGVDYESFERKAFYDKLDRAKQAVGEDLVGILDNLISTFAERK